MKKTLITLVCALIFFAGYSQNTDERYEYCTFRINNGFSEGAQTTDIVISKDKLDESLRLASTDVFFSKDIIFDVQFLSFEDGAVIRVFHLMEVTSDDVKALFSQVAGNLDYVIQPSERFKMDARSED